MLLKVLPSLPHQIWKRTVATGLENVTFHPNSKEGNAKEYSNYSTVAFISHGSKVMLKIL